ncbi:hypothetical protein CSUI_002258 [Cystoisospora suis]|uniref:Uncharacterized protein n=1 Tax=Cystoisospora suis TaxID=483139 RepID=A0A2C6KUL3_9APIC|nr:hypothetical protein CSUI_002258 [Cystoisospora suis]
MRSDCSSIFLFCFLFIYLSFSFHLFFAEFYAEMHLGLVTASPIYSSQISDRDLSNHLCVSVYSFFLVSWKRNRSFHSQEKGRRI